MHDAGTIIYIIVCGITGEISGSGSYFVEVVLWFLSSIILTNWQIQSLESNNLSKISVAISGLAIKEFIWYFP